MLDTGKNSLKIVDWLNAEIIYLIPLDVLLQLRMTAACQFKKKTPTLKLTQLLKSNYRIHALLYREAYSFCI